jgi:steroid 5-alpha reductase family enzyme
MDIVLIKMLLTQGFILASALMISFWILSLLIKNAGVIDIGWALSLVLLACFYAIKADGFLPRSALIVLMVAFWGFRLSMLLVTRLLREQHEDKRYQKLRADWKPYVELKFLALFEVEAILALTLSIPFLLTAVNPRPELQLIEICAVFIWLGGFAGEVIADEQLKRFKSDVSNKGKTCDVGLWYYSRHPNYFFEWLMWCAYFIFALGSPWGWVSVICPFIMYHFLINVTGVPFAEAQSLMTRGEEYRRYQQSTSMFIPLPKRKI